MASAGARPLNLLLRWHDGLLWSSLSDGHALGEIAQHLVDAAMLDHISAGVMRVWRAHDQRLAREHLGRLIFQELLPAPLRHRLETTDGTTLQLQINDALMGVPWEWAFDGAQCMGQKFAMFRHLLWAAPPPRGRARPAG